MFQELRGLIDRGRRAGKGTGRFLILGSASMDLLRQSGESLAGRIEYVPLNPLDVLDVTAATAPMAALWVRGGFPDSLLAASDTDSLAFRRDFIRTYLQRDVSEFTQRRLPAETLERLWTMLAHGQGGLLNASRLAASLGVSSPTVTGYIDLLVDLLLVRRLRPFHANIRKRLVKSPKVYVRDSGLVHALLGIEDYNALAGHPVAGASWEGFVIENLLAAVPPGTAASFFRTQAGAEIDLVLELPGAAQALGHRGQARPDPPSEPRLPQRPRRHRTGAVLHRLFGGRALPAVRGRGGDRPARDGRGSPGARIAAAPGCRPWRTPPATASSSGPATTA